MRLTNYTNFAAQLICCTSPSLVRQCPISQGLAFHTTDALAENRSPLVSSDSRYSLTKPRHVPV